MESAMPRVTSVINVHYIPFGGTRGAIYRRTDIANSSWFFRIHLKKEKRYYRVSLKTRNRAEALENAERVMRQVFTKVDTGQSVMAISLELGELVRAFRQHLANQVQTGQLRGRTETMQRYRVQIGLDFLKNKYPDGLRTRVSEIDGEVFKGYLSWRQAAVAAKRKNGTIRRDVVRDELIVVRKMFRYGLLQKLCTAKQLPVWDFAIEKNPPIRRRVGNDDIQSLMDVMAEWNSEPAVPAEEYHRFLVMCVVLLVEGSGLRSGEVFGLKNKFVEPLGPRQLRVTVKAETSKVGRERVIRVDDPFLIEFWIEKYQRFHDPDDYFFSPYKSGNVSARDVFYHAYRALRERLKKLDLQWLDLYHCRHWYITQRLMAKESIHLVAKAVGTSVAQIEKTYSNVLTEQITEKFSETEVVFDKFGRFKIKKVKAR
jgi:hypothetical protein